ncbi:MAG: hypothetical protein Fur0021_32470 [Candidatus Promineifilaceae bacterium]
MKQWLSLSVLTLMGMALLSACGSQPQISVTEPRLNLGDVVNGEVITRQINVQNKGQADLVIEAVTTSCGCTQARLEPMTIAAGSSGALSIQFDSGAHGPALTGEIVRQVFILSNDPQQPEMVVELMANILPPNGS